MLTESAREMSRMPGPFIVLAQSGGGLLAYSLRVVRDELAPAPFTEVALLLVGGSAVLFNS